MTALQQLPMIDPDLLDGLRALDADGQSGLLAHCVQLFLGEAQTLVAAVSRSCTDENRAEVERAAHALRGAASMIGARRLAAIAEAVERAAERCPLRALQRMVCHLESALHELHPALLAAAEIAG